MKKIFQTIIISIFVRTVFASNLDDLPLLQEQQESLEEEQRTWASHYISMPGASKSANPSEDLTKEFASLSLAPST